MLINWILNGKCVCPKCTAETWQLGQKEIPPLRRRHLIVFSYLCLLSYCSFTNHCTISSVLLLFVTCLGLSQEKVANFIKRLRTEPRYLLAQNVSTCIDPLEVCLHRQTVQDTVHIFQHSIPTEGKPVTNQKNSGKL